MKDGLINQAKTANDFGILGSLMIAEFNLNMAKDILKGNWHYAMDINPKYYEEIAELKIKQAECDLREAELQIISRKEGFISDN